MIYLGIAIAFIVLFLLFIVAMCGQTGHADEVMMLAYKEWMEERAKKEGVREITSGGEEGNSGVGCPS